jgi:hypothetical protein
VNAAETSNEYLRYGKRGYDDPEDAEQEEGDERRQY